MSWNLACGGKVRNREGEWVDITPQLIKAWRDEAQRLEKLILAYELRSGHTLPTPIAV